MPKGFTVRLDDDQAAELKAIAKVDGVSVAEEIRQAITVQIAERRKESARRVSGRRAARPPPTTTGYPHGCSAGSLDSVQFLHLRS